MKAWELIEQTGWCQKKQVKRKRGVIVGYCAVEAINEIYGGGNVLVYWAAYDKVRAMTGDVNIVQWNDQPGQTKEHVVATLKGVDV